jgi:hypothetical protein
MLAKQKHTSDGMSDDQWAINLLKVQEFLTLQL